MTVIDAFSALPHRAALRRIANRGVSVRTVIDVGASNGVWSQSIESVFPDAQYHLIDAFEHWRADLERLCASRRNYSCTIALAGAQDGEGHFYNSPDAPFGGYTASKSDAHAFRVPTVAMDGEVVRHGLQPPYLLKLDTHGAERDILAGAQKLLKQTEILVVEVYNFMDEARRFPAMTQHIESFGFQCIDIAEPLFRPHDEAFWQIDLFFVRSTRPEAMHRAY